MKYKLILPDVYVDIEDRTTPDAVLKHRLWIQLITRLRSQVFKHMNYNRFESKLTKSIVVPLFEQTTPITDSFYN